MSTKRSRLFAAGVVAGAAFTLATGAAAPARAASEFGEHVSSCAQTVGFSADHNPGMHQGFHGWDPIHTC
jgi:hypothetical protein